MPRSPWPHEPAVSRRTLFTGRRLDVALAVLILLMQTVAASVVYGGWQGPTPTHLALVLLGAVALSWRRRHPLAITVLTVAADSALPLVPPHHSWVPMASLVALYTLATQSGRRRAAWTIGVAAGLWLALTAGLAHSHEGLGNAVTSLVNLDYAIIATAVGDSVRNRRAYLAQAQERAEQAERTRDEEARRRVREERIRIARDLHDVVAHHITLLNAQAGVARHFVRSDPEKAYLVLSNITETSAAALDELRATVSLLRQDDDPPASLQPVPAFDQADGLIRSFCEAGLDVRVTVQGARRPVAPTADLAAFRILQEALTNAHKHGTRPTADVSLTYTDTTLRVTVTNSAAAGRRGEGSGHGIIGMRERAEAAHGTLAAALSGDSFRVHATLPLAPVKKERP